MAPCSALSSSTEDTFLVCSARLMEEFEQAVRNRAWSEVQRLAGALLALERGLSSPSSSESEESSRVMDDGSMPSLSNTLTSGSDMHTVEMDDSSRRSSRSNNSDSYDRLTVLQAGPLVYFGGENASWEPFPPINFRWEKDAIVKAVKDAGRTGTIDVKFDIATHDRFNAFLADVQNSPILFISCHGMVDGKLAFETGKGSEKFMTDKDLQSYSSLSSLKAVFVSACHSRSIGDAFVKAGVKHGTRSSSHATVKEAYDLAKAQVKHSPFIDESHVEVDKFILLPERDDEYHNVPIFFQRPNVPPPVVEERPRRISIPTLPSEFMGRNVEAFDIVNSLLKYDVVKLVGRKGLGKKSLAIFVAKYVSERHHYSNVLCWCSSSERQDTAVSLEQIRNDMTGLEVVEDNKNTLLVLDAAKFSHLGVAALSEELRNIRNLQTKVKMLIVSEHEGAVEFPTLVRVKTIELEPLTYESTATLFASVCPYVNQNSKYADPIVYSVPDFLNLVFRRPYFRKERYVKVEMPKRAETLFKWLGQGYPRKILNTAWNLSPGDYKDIIRLAKKFDVILEHFGTRRQLENAILRTRVEMVDAPKHGLIHKAQAAWDRLQELERLRESKLSEELLRQQRAQVKADLERAKEECREACYSNRDAYLELSKRARALSADLETVEFQIELEGEVEVSEEVSSGAVDDTPGEAVDDEEVDHLIPIVGKIFVVDDNAAPRRPSSLTVVRPLLKYRINVKHSFFLQINQGPTQSFTYPSPERAAIVVASNEACTGGQGILRAVTDAGGPALLQDVNDRLPSVLHSEFGRIRCLAGDAKMVGPGSYGTLGVPYVMFAVGPWFTSENEEHRLLFLTGAYRSALKLAQEYRLEAVAFSLIGSSCRGGESWKETVEIGLNTIIRFHGYPELKEIHLFGFTSDEATELKERSTEAHDKFEHMNLEEVLSE